MNKLLIKHSGSYNPERSYIFSVIFSEFLGINYEENICKINDIHITLIGDKQNKEIIISDIFFNIPEDQWLTSNSIPSQPLEKWYLSDEYDSIQTVTKDLPVIYGNKIDNNDYFKNSSNNSIEIGIDIFGSAFFMLSRYEEIVNKQRDIHNRFSATASLAFQENFLERPIINEYIEILWFAIKILWKNLKRKERKYNIQLSHDVDHPLYTHGKSFFGLCKNLAGDIVRRHSISQFLRNIKAMILKNFHSNDPFNTFDLIMDISEKHNITSTFYFKADKTNEIYDTQAYLTNPWVQNLLIKINKRGHKIGLHPSYNTYKDCNQTKSEFEQLLSILEKCNINQNEFGGRQHYLRWENPTTWQVYEDSDLQFDNTLTYAEHSGFRCGVCYEFPVFNLLTRTRLNLIEKPLIVMEGTLFGENYMNLQIDEASNYVKKLSKICKIFQGDFTFLVHNNFLTNKRIKKWYRDAVSIAI